MMCPDHHEKQYIDTDAKLVNVRIENCDQPVPALVLSFRLAENIRDALCLGSGLQYARATKDTHDDKLADLKAESRLAACKIDLLQDKLKSSTDDMQEEIEGCLIKAYKKQESLDRQIVAETKNKEYLADLVSRSHNSLEAGWSKVDSDIRQAFEGSGFVISSSSDRKHLGHKVNASNPAGYAGNETYILQEVRHNSLSEIVGVASNDFHGQQATCTDLIIKRKGAVAIRTVNTDYFHGTMKVTNLNRAMFRETRQDKKLILGLKQMPARELFCKFYQMARYLNVDHIASWPTMMNLTSEQAEDKNNDLTIDFTSTKDSPSLLADVVPQGHELVLWQDPNLPPQATEFDSCTTESRDDRSMSHELTTYNEEILKYDQYSSVKDQNFNLGHDEPDRAMNLWPIQVFNQSLSPDGVEQISENLTAHNQEIVEIGSVEAPAKNPSTEVDTIESQNMATKQDSGLDHERAVHKISVSIKDILKDRATASNALSQSVCMPAQLGAEQHSDTKEDPPQILEERNTTAVVQVDSIAQNEHVTHPVTSDLPEVSNNLPSLDSEVQNHSAADSSAAEAAAIEQWNNFKENQAGEQQHTSDKVMVEYGSALVASSSEENKNTRSEHSLAVEEGEKPFHQEAALILTEVSEEDPIPTPEHKEAEKPSPAPSNGVAPVPTEVSEEDPTQTREKKDAESPPPALATKIPEIQTDDTRPQQIIQSGNTEQGSSLESTGSRKRTNDASNPSATEAPKTQAGDAQPRDIVQSSSTERCRIPKFTGKRRRANYDCECPASKRFKFSTPEPTASFHTTQNIWQSPEGNLTDEYDNDYSAYYVDAMDFRED